MSPLQHEPMPCQCVSRPGSPTRCFERIGGSLRTTMILWEPASDRVSHDTRSKASGERPLSCWALACCCKGIARSRFLPTGAFTRIPHAPASGTNFRVGRALAAGPGFGNSGAVSGDIVSHQRAGGATDWFNRLAGDSGCRKRETSAHERESRLAAVRPPYRSHRCAGQYCGSQHDMLEPAFPHGSLHGPTSAMRITFLRR